LKAQFPVFVVDEYQDLGLALDRLVRSLCFDAGMRVIAVGDPDQSVYGFTGAKPELLKELAARPDVECVSLALNYRSGDRLVRAAKAALGEDRGYESYSGEEGVVYAQVCPGGLDGQVAYLVDQLLPALQRRFRLGQIAVLFPTKYEGGKIENALLGADVAYVRLGTNAAYEKTPVTRVVEELAAWCAVGLEGRGTRLSRLLRRWTNLQGLRNPEVMRAQRQRLVRFLFNNRTADASASEWLNALERQIIAMDGCRQRLTDRGEVEPLDILMNVVKPGGILEGFTVANLGGQLGSPNHLNLVTLHSSKGSEFDVVVLVGADEGSLPWGDDRGPILAEKRRLFYVAVSRSRQEFYVLSSPPMPGDRRRQGTSRFVTEMMKQLEQAT